MHHYNLYNDNKILQLLHADEDLYVVPKSKIKSDFMKMGPSNNFFKIGKMLNTVIKLKEKHKFLMGHTQ